MGMAIQPAVSKGIPLSAFDLQSPNRGDQKGATTQAEALNQNGSTLRASDPRRIHSESINAVHHSSLSSKHTFGNHPLVLGGLLLER